MPRVAGAMRRTDGARTGSDLFEQQRRGNIKITDTLMDAHANDIANEITNSIPRDGSAAPTRDTPWGTKKIKGLGDAVNDDEAVNLGQARALSTPLVPASGVGGTGDAITLNPGDTASDRSTGQRYRFIAKHNNGGAATLAIGATAAVTLKDGSGSDLKVGDIKAGQHLVVVFDGTYWRLDNGGAGSGAAATDPFLTATPGLGADSDGDGAVVLRFILPASSTPITARTIQHKTASQTWAQATEIAAAGSPYRVTGLTNGVERQFRVNATNGTGDCAWSSVESATPSPRPHVVTAAGVSVFNWPWPETHAVLIVQGGGGGGGGAGTSSPFSSAGADGADSSVTVGSVTLTAAGGSGGAAGSGSRVAVGNGGNGARLTRDESGTVGESGAAGEISRQIVSGIAAGAAIAITVGAGGAAGQSQIGQLRAANTAAQPGSAGFAIISPL